ncbi:toll-like receptor 4 [Mytilus trossulus]|uniref:toll-like receptor 4 n=1 Tax=Mytilus trossulus TaxID=6551 RepID=UPI0030069C96
MIAKFIYLLVILKEGQCAGWFNFTYESIPNNFLFCDQCCQSGECSFHKVYYEKDTLIRCCVSNWSVMKIKTLWDLEPELVEKLHIEYTSIFGTADVLVETEGMFYQVIHQDGYLSFIPDNICSFPDIVEIDFSNNYINSIMGIHCLSKLDTLILKGNKMKRITKDMFKILTFLRHLDLSNNQINHLDIGSLAHPPNSSLLYIDVSFNDLKVIDVSNLISGSFYNRIDLSYNKLSTITNEKGWKGFNIGDSTGGGSIDISNNEFTHFPNLSMIGFASEYTVTRFAFTYKLIFGNNNWTCDCNLWNDYLTFFLKAFDYHPGAISFYSIPCSNPPELRKYVVTDFQKNETNELQHLLICNITCAHKCTCFHQPSKNRTVINCSGLALKVMPNHMPYFNNLEIDLSMNNLSKLDGKDYLYRATKLNISNNHITTISPIVYKIPNLNLIDFRGNSFDTLSNDVRLKSPCSLLFGHLIMKCTCELQWLPIWLEQQKLPNCMVNRIECISSGKNASSMSPSEFCIKDNTTKRIIISIILTSVLVILMIITLVCRHYRYEIYLLWRSNKFKNLKSRVHSLPEYDVYICFDEDNEMARRWIVGVLLRFLEGKRYKVLLPCRDFSFGGVREEEMRSSIWKCSSWIILQSENYFHSTYGENEWKIIWNTYKINLETKIIIINYDVIESDCISVRNFRAFIKLGYALDFCNIDKNLLNEVRKRLGPPANRFTTELQSSKL